MTKKEQAELTEKINKALAEADAEAKAGGASDRLGFVGPKNAALINALLDELFCAIPASKRGEYLGHLNEIGCYLNGCHRAIHALHKTKDAEGAAPPAKPQATV